ncbi:alginate O-acetyltransferase [Pseudomonas cremoricolorata]|uniref:Alginate O-acetyltransferase n=1 Tax=Pseudomonas cremoricolorata TaxID=157783 RepID=A0A089WP80_9PSED|nr:alginate O-acetyltransferase [Pseudomonas cremoricolorata]
MGRRRTEIAIPQLPRISNFSFLEYEVDFLNRL